MNRMSVATAVATTSHVLHALPTGCIEDVHCASEFFCDQESLFCRPCLQCQQLNRLPAVAACVTSVAECGACQNGWTEDVIRRSAMCIPTPLLQSAWPIIIASLLFVALLVCIGTIFALRNFKAYKFLCVTGTVERPPDGAESEGTPLSPPPPYNTVVSPDHPNYRNIQAASAPPAPPACGSPLSERRLERARTQTARVFVDDDATVDNAVNMPPSYDSAARLEGSLPTFTVDSDNSAPNRDVRTTPPYSGDNEANVFHNQATSMPRERQDSSTQSDEPEGEGCGRGCAPPPPFILNVMNNITTVQQLNDLNVC